MKRIAISAVVSTGLTAICILSETGCSSLGSKASGWAAASKHKSAPPAAIGKVDSDRLGRALPGSKSPIPPEVTEAKPEITDETRSHVALAMGEMLESVGNLEAAQEQYETALKNDPKSLNSSLALARVYARQGRPDAALKVYQTAEKHHRRSAAVFNDKGLLLADQKDWPGAIAALRTAVKLEPNETKYHNNLGMILAVSGSYEEAYKEFREAVGAGPAHYNVALMLMQADRTVEARNHLERALTAMPTLEKAQQLLAQLDGRATETSLASNEREVEVDLDHKTADEKTLQSVSSYDSQVEHAAASEPVETAPAKPATPPAKKDASPWSRRWVPPKWLR